MNELALMEPAKPYITTVLLVPLSTLILFSTHPATPNSILFFPLFKYY